MAKFNTKTKRVSTQTKNLAGGDGFKMSPELELIHGVLTTFLDDKYYESGDERQERLEQLVGLCDPEFVAKLAIIARKEFHLRSVSHLLIGNLALIHSGDDLVKRAIVAATERPDDLTELAYYVMANSDNNVLTKQVKRGIRNALLMFDKYQLAKYKGEGREVSLVDLFNLVHPRAELATKEQKKAWKELMNGTLKREGTVENITTNSELDDEEKGEALEEMILSDKIGYMALLRNLKNLVEKGVSEKAIKKAAKIISDPERVRKSKQLPFRFYTAFQNVHGNRILTDAISEALDIAVENAPKFDGKTLIAVDTSGSMDGRPIEIAGIFAATILKANKGADVVLYDTQIAEFNGSGRTPVLDLVDRIKKEALGGGTATSIVFKYAQEKGDKYDRVIILSDNQSWADGYRDSVQDAMEEYMKATDANPVVFAIDIQGYGTRDIKSPNVFYVAGWSERILDFIGKVEDRESLLKYVREYEF